MEISVGTIATAQAPGRIDLFGTWSDDPLLLPWHPSRVISCAISLNESSLPIGVELSIRSKSVITVQSVDLNFEAELSFADLISNPLAMAIVATLKAEDAQTASEIFRNGLGLSIITRSTLPFRSGLGASSSLTVCGCAAAMRLLNVPIDPLDLAEGAFQLESCTYHVGWQDHYAAVFGGANLITRSDNDVHASVSALSSSLSILIREHGVISFLTGSPHDSLRWPPPSPMIRSRVEQMDRILGEFLKHEQTITIAEFQQLLERHWHLARYWYHSNDVKDLGQAVQELRDLTASAVYVGAGPAALFLSPWPSRYLRDVMRVRLKVPSLIVFPSQRGVVTT